MIDALFKASHIYWLQGYALGFQSTAMDMAMMLGEEVDCFGDFDYAHSCLAENIDYLTLQRREEHELLYTIWAKFDNKKLTGHKSEEMDKLIENLIMKVCERINMSEGQQFDEKLRIFPIMAILNILLDLIKIVSTNEIHR